ncbi:MAG: hypothetical protein PHX61_04720 [Alphaproteobacteria bacterium]|nr:hypothetical protein [Alphaproteobacteria bacterium]
MSAVEHFQNNFQPGEVYRRADLEQWSNAVDRHLVQLQESGVLVKLSGGLYFCPQMTAFGPAPADDETLVRAFLKDDRFLLTSSNLYNTLGLGTTQLYNETVVYNHKRHGRFKLGGRTFRFAMKPYFPRKATPEFLLVDVVNNINQLAEDRESVLEQVKIKASSMESRVLAEAIREYGGARAKKFFSKLLIDDRLQHAR